MQEIAILLVGVLNAWKMFLQIPIPQKCTTLMRMWNLWNGTYEIFVIGHMKFLMRHKISAMGYMNFFQWDVWNFCNGMYEVSAMGHIKFLQWDKWNFCTGIYEIPAMGHTKFLQWDIWNFCDGYEISAMGLIKFLHMIYEISAMGHVKSAMGYKISDMGHTKFLQWDT